MPSLSEPTTARPVTRVEKRQQTRQQLRESALHAVVKHGIAGASVNTISDSAGYSRGAFYGNYENKYELLLETMVERLNKEALTWERLIVEASDVESMLAEVEKRLLPRTSPDWAVLTLELQLHAHRDRAFGRSFSALLRQHNAAGAHLYQAIFEKAGRVPPDDLRAIAASGFALGMGLKLQAESGIRPGDSRYAARMFMLFLRGLISIAEPAGAAVAAAPAPRKRAAKVARSS